jgi:hypothetical protein
MPLQNEEQGVKDRRSAVPLYIDKEHGHAAGRLSMALVILLCGLTSAVAAPRLSAPRPAPSLVGWVSFCQQNASECEV